MTECLDEESILTFCRGTMPPAKRPAAEAHIAECEECRVLVSAVMRSSLVDPADVARPDTAMAPTTPLQGGFAVSGAQRRPSGASRASAPVNPGDVLAGKYEVERVLGAGGMGVVVAVRHTQLDQRFAIKFLLPAAYEAPGAVARFVREGKAAAQITSEHVARVVDTGVLDSGAPYLVMEYLEGSDLGEIGARRGRLDPEEAVEYVLQACEAIVEAHQLGIVHRDLKPANLFLTRRKDGSPLVKVLDFGISKADTGSPSQLTSTSTLMGSPRYMSPEQMVSARDVDARTDVWALGVILYELVTGMPVWHADTLQGLCALIATAPTPALRASVPKAPALLEQTIQRCLEKAPKDRIASIADLALALEPITPERAVMSIERILGVAGRPRQRTSQRPSGVQRLAPAAEPEPPSHRAPSSVTDRRQPTTSNRRFVVALAALIGALVIAGVFLNTLVLRPDSPNARASEPLAPPSAPAASVAASAAPMPAGSLAEPAASVVAADPSATPPPAAKSSLRNRPPSAGAARAPTAPRDLPDRNDSPTRALSDRK